MPNDALVERDGLVQVGHRHPDVVDANQADACDRFRSAGVGIVGSHGVSLTEHALRQVGGRPLMTSVILNGARTPMGRLSGNLKDLSATQLGSVAIKAALERSGVAPDQVQYVIMGQVLQAGGGQITARQAAVGAGIPMSTPAADREQGVPVRPGRDRAGRPAHPGRRVRHRRGRRHGVDDQRPAPADGLPGRLQVRRRDHGRPHRVGRPDRRVRAPLHGRVDRRRQRQARHQPGRAGRVRGPQPPARRGRPEERRVRRGDRPGVASRSARATRS